MEKQKITKTCVLFFNFKNFKSHLSLTSFIMSSLFLLVAGYVRQVIKTKKSNDDLSKLFCDFYDNPCNYPIGADKSDLSSRLIAFGKCDDEAKYELVLNHFEFSNISITVIISEDDFFSSTTTVEENAYHRTVDITDGDLLGKIKIIVDPKNAIIARHLIDLKSTYYGPKKRILASAADLEPIIFQNNYIYVIYNKSPAPPYWAMDLASYLTGTDEIQPKWRKASIDNLIKIESKKYQKGKLILQTK